MKPFFLILLGVILTTSGCSATPPQLSPKVLLAQADTSKIAQVKAGTLKTANASWWGFDKDDATDCLQNAINSGVPKLIVDNTGSDWIVNKSITLVSNQQIIFADGVVVQAKKDSFHSKWESLFSGSGVSNVVLQGEGKAILQMRKSDYQDATKYLPAEWRMGINLNDCTNITIRNLTVAKTGGDGLYIGARDDGACKDILVDNVIFDDNHRQGMSVISVDGLTVRNSKFINTSGTAPQAGIDFEPNAAGQRLVNCVLDNCVFAHNKGDGIDIYAVHLDGKSPPISITVNRSTVYGNHSGFASVVAQSATNPATGNVTFNDCKFDHNVIELGDAIMGSVHYLFKNCTLDTSSVNGKTSWQRAIMLSTHGNIKNPKIGNISFDNTTVIDDKDKAPIGFNFQQGSFGYQTTLSDEISGMLYVKNKGRAKKFDLPTFLKKSREEMEKNDPVNILKSQYSDVNIQDITKQWHFLPDPATGTNVTSPTFDDSAWKIIDAGNWWQRSGYPAYHGLAWYRKTLTITALSTTQNALLFFDGVDGTCQVYVNGKKVGEHIVAEDHTGWNTPFRIDITNALQAGKNVIAVQVASKSLDTASGINEPVHLVIGSPKK